MTFYEVIANSIPIYLGFRRTGKKRRFKLADLFPLIFLGILWEVKILLHNLTKRLKSFYIT